MPRDDWQDRRHIELEPKPFGKVPLSRTVPRRQVPRDLAQRRAKGNDKYVPPHDRFRPGLAGRLDGTLSLVTPMHVGSGIYDLRQGEVIRGLVFNGSDPVIPGTSLKGAVRSTAEAISRSCLRITRREIQRSLSSRQAEPCKNVRAASSGRSDLCTCCSLFGALGYRGRVAFGEARTTGARTSIHRVQSPYPPREGARAYRNDRREFDGRKFYYHGAPATVKSGEPYLAIDPQSTFRFSMHFENVSEEELCLLLVAMGISDDLIIKMGGGKQAMLGSVEVYPETLEIIDPAASFSDFTGGVRSLGGDQLKAFIDGIGNGHSGLIDEEALDALMKIWDRNSPHPAPKGMY
jgi:CRISPR/Cas system CSM-associated protein Csm3 (group 7 of RAMP superfamily)